jgi:hypothetical protein
LITKKAHGSATSGVIVESSIANPDFMVAKAHEGNILMTLKQGDTSKLREIFAAYGEIVDTFEKPSALGTRFIVQYLEKSDAV